MTRWILQQRMNFRDGRISDIRVKKLNEAGLILIPQAQKDELWDKKFSELVNFRKEHPDSWPTKHSADPYNKLFEWGQVQKTKLVRNPKSRKPYQEVRYQKLVQLGFPFERQTLLIKTWDDIFELLRESLKYKKKPVKLPFKEKGRETKLSKWLRMQLKMVNDDTLSPEQIKKLKTIKVLLPLIADK